MIRTTFFTLAIAGLLSISSSQAAFVLLDNFDSYAQGPDITAANAAWSSNDTPSNPFAVTADPGGRAGNSLQSAAIPSGGQGESPVARLGLSGTAGTTSTLYFEYYSTNADLTVDVGVGPADGGDGFENFNTYHGFLGPRTNPAESGNAYARDGNTTKFPLDQDALFQPDTWYSVWMVVDDVSQNTNIYVQGGLFVNQTQLTAAGDGDFGFRSSNPFTSFMVAKGRNTAPGEDFYIDNLHLDVGNVNLNQIPEPSSVLLVCLLGVVVGAARRSMR